MAQITKLKSAGQAGDNPVKVLVEVLIAMVILLSLMFTANDGYSRYGEALRWRR